MGEHITEGVVAPTFTPTRNSQHYLNTANGDKYISSGTVSSADWGSPIGSGGGGVGDEVTAKIFSPQKTTGAGTHTFPDLTTGVPVGIAGANLSGVGNITVTHTNDAAFTFAKCDNAGTGTVNIDNASPGGVLFADVNVTSVGLNNAVQFGSTVYSNFTFVTAVASNNSAAINVDNDSDGGLIFGKLVASSTGYATFSNISEGGLVFGDITATGNSKITGSGDGSLTGGRIFNGQSSSLCIIRSNGLARGAIAFGHVTKTGSNAATLKIETNNEGTMAFGHCSALDTFDSEISTNGTDKFGAIASGASIATTAISSIKSDGIGAFAHGFAQDGLLEATGDGSVAFGATTTGNVQATATNSFQFGVGTNATADTFQVGNGGIRFKGTTGVPAVLQNGDQWVAAGYAYIRSNGVSVKIV